MILLAATPVKVIKKLEPSLMTALLLISVIVRASKPIESNPIESVPSVKSETVSPSL